MSQTNKTLLEELVFKAPSFDLNDRICIESPLLTELEELKQTVRGLKRTIEDMLERLDPPPTKKQKTESFQQKEKE
jgi:hypothetical protein